MKKTILLFTIIAMFHFDGICQSKNVGFAKYPHVDLYNKEVKMTVYLPDAENGIYRATRYDWSGVIGSLQYKGHEYFEFQRENYDPERTMSMPGPAGTYKSAGLGYDEAKPGEKFIRIGVGFIEKEDETAYDYHNHYKLIDPGKWIIDQGEDWISFTHTINSTFGYGYIYKKTILLKEDGFEMEHRLQNTGKKIIETDQYNHNFFVIDNEKCNPAIQISYPYPVTTKDDLKGKMKIKSNTLHFTRELERGGVFMKLKGYGAKAEDNQFTIENTNSATGVTVSVDQPIIKLEFWTNGMMICPENTMQISVKPGDEQVWTSNYTLFAK